MVRFYISWEKYAAKILFSMVIIFIAGFIFGPSIYFQFSDIAGVALAADAGYGGGNLYCPAMISLPPGKVPTIALSATDQSVIVGNDVSFTVTTTNFDNPSYSI